MEYVAPIISAFCAILVAYFGYNQKQKDAKTELWKRSQEEKFERRNANIAKITGRLWECLHNTQADRVYTIQPHPLSKAFYISITLEVARNGIASMIDEVQNLEIRKVAKFAEDLSLRDFIVYKNVAEDCKDKKARAILGSNGTHSAVLKQLSDDAHDWVGTVVCEFTRVTDLNTIYIKDCLIKTADDIQYILPENK